MLLDISPDGPEVAKHLPTKKRASRRKNGAAVASSSFKDKMQVVDQVAPDRPNWPDSEFPWRIRSEERAEIAKAEEAERLRWIEKFLDRDSDEEDDNDEEEDISVSWGETHIELPTSGKGGGKMVPLMANPTNPNTLPRSRNTFHLSDPADARAALMSKRSVRALFYQQQQRASRQNDDNESNEEVVCVCNGQDDGRELVQCDGCQIWYHLHCIGIKSVAELGREEDPWYCDQCSRTVLTRTQSPAFAPASEPTFVKMNDEPTTIPSFDLPFFQPPFQDSPITSWSSQPSATPTQAYPLGPSFTPESSWNNLKHSPSTPHVPLHEVRPYATPGLFEGFGEAESPFDPTSTPSRGIKFAAPFATPKNSLWSMRANRLFQTPSQVRTSNHTAQASGSLLSSLSEEQNPAGHLGGYRSLPMYDDSPIRRTKSRDAPKASTSRHLGSPVPTSLLPTSSLPPSLDEWRVMDRKRTEQFQDIAVTPSWRNQENSASVGVEKGGVSDSVRLSERGFNEVYPA